MARILYIDTDEQYGKYICNLLKSAGHTPIFEKQGSRAIALVEEHKIDMVLTEVMLPDVCGFEICRRIRAHTDLFTLPVLLMSSMAAEDEIAHGFAQGADDYLAKPCEPRVLVARVEQQLKYAGTAAQPDAITNLPNPKTMKAAIQRAINLKLRFATAYIELLSLTPFAKVHGAELRDKALRHLARILERYGDHLNTPMFQVAHMGMGHFVCLMEADNATAFCKGVLKSWENHLPEFYAAVGIKEAPRANATTALSLMLCVTDSHASGAQTTQQYFEVLAQLRKKAIASGNGGIYIDNRKGV